jgi:hypothetical protein
MNEHANHRLHFIMAAPWTLRFPASLFFQGFAGFFLIFFPCVADAFAQTDNAQANRDTVPFENYFLDRALRLEMLQVGNSREFVTTVQTYAEESCWPEFPDHLITPFPYGKFMIRVHDAASGRLLFTRGFDTLFAEYATTKPAMEGIQRGFETTVRIPMPKAAIKLSIDHRQRDNSYRTVLSQYLDPSDTRIRRESTSNGDEVIQIQKSGVPQECVDIVFLAEGYTSSQKGEFEQDVARMTEHLFRVEPFQTNQSRFNVCGVFRPSEESGTDNPNKGEFRNTALNSSFNTLDIDRYLLVEDNHRMHQMAARVPYDAIVVLVNTTTYGGGSICLDYCACSSDSILSEMVFVHELGHGLAYLADEYVGNVSYNDIYPENIEPVEPNITRQLDPKLIKWKSRLTQGIRLPTPADIVNATDKVVGAFEGAGYLSRGIYRSQQYCLMGSTNPKEHLCAACEDAISSMIHFYSPKSQVANPNE